MIDDGMPPKSASDPSVARQAGSCWLSTKPWLMASFGSKCADQLVDHDLGVGGVQAVAAHPVGDHRERVGHIRVRHLRPALRHRQHDVERLEVAAVLWLQLDALRLEEVGQRARGRRGDRHRRRGGDGRCRVPPRRSRRWRASRRADRRPGARSRRRDGARSASQWPGRAAAVAGCTGSAEAVAPAKPTTPATPAAAPPARIRQRRAILVHRRRSFRHARGLVTSLVRRRLYPRAE